MENARGAVAADGPRSRHRTEDSLEEAWKRCTAVTAVMATLFLLIVWLFGGPLARWLAASRGHRSRTFSSHGLPTYSTLLSGLSLAGNTLPPGWRRVSGIGTLTVLK